MLLMILVVAVLVLAGLGLMVLFHHFTVQEMSKNTAHLQALSQEYIKKQEELRQRIAEGDKHYREQLEMTKAELDRMKTQAMAETEAMRQQILNQARQESELLVQKSLESKEALKRELEQAMQKRVLESAQELVEQSLSTELAQTIQARWLDELINQGLADVSAIASKEAVSEARVVSAVALNEDQRKRLQQKLEKLAGRAIAIQDSVDPQLLAGLMISLGHTVLDGSLRSRLERAARQSTNGNHEQPGNNGTH